ncbi:Os02g0517465 [Oryza sativa Japonica Group]|uniref:Os02g0517465 protein n=1 Tax=Oryza sativa subsp. japonica TaxID=39947 RepID=C7IYS4_ORYSJ|nr:Os02g0517465 [Oryza sativa Japonica Group]|eukprot:NP_001172987.1 Os02g0517465 [Oryza sativa Japonica Group]
MPGGFILAWLTRPDYTRGACVCGHPAAIQIQICIKGIHGFKLISYTPGMDQTIADFALAKGATNINRAERMKDQFALISCLSQCMETDGPFPIHPNNAQLRQLINMVDSPFASSS